MFFSRSVRPLFSLGGGVTARAHQFGSKGERGSSRQNLSLARLCEQSCVYCAGLLVLLAIYLHVEHVPLQAKRPLVTQRFGMDNTIHIPRTTFQMAQFEEEEWAPLIQSALGGCCICRLLEAILIMEKREPGDPETLAISVKKEAGEKCYGVIFGRRVGEEVVGHYAELLLREAELCTTGTCSSCIRNDGNSVSTLMCSLTKYRVYFSWSREEAGQESKGLDSLCLFFITFVCLFEKTKWLSRISCKSYSW